MGHLIFLLVAAMDDDKQQALDPVDVRMTEICFQKTIGLPRYTELSNICQYNGVDCHNGVMWKLSWEAFRRKGKKCVHVESFNWLPPTLRKVHFARLEHPKHLITRRLPRVMKFCWMVSCQIQGSVNLRTLPQSLLILNLMKNNISGTVILLNLPEKLSYISLCANSLRKVIVDNASLPSSLSAANFQDYENRAKFVTTDGSVLHKCVGSIFSEYQTSSRYKVKEYEGW